MAHRARPLLWSLPFLLVGALLWFATRLKPGVEGGGAPEAAQAVVSAVASEAAELQSAATAELQATPADPGSSDRAAVQPQSELPPNAEAPAETPDQVFIEGEVLAMDIRGQALEPQDGEVTLRLLRSKDSIHGDGLEFTAKVEAGRFRQALEFSREQLELCDRFEVASGALAGRPATPPVPLGGDEGRVQPFRLDQALRIWLVCMPEHRIEVFAAESGEPIARACAVPATPQWDRLTTMELPPSALSECPLPIPVYPGESLQAFVVLRVGAPGRAWKTVALEVATPGPTRVELERSCTLEISWPGSKAQADLLLHHPESHRGVLSLERGGAPLRVEGLPPGRVRVLGRINLIGGSEQTTYASAEGMLVAGETKQLVLFEDQGVGAGLTTVAGRVRISKEWNLNSFTLKGQPADPIVPALNEAGIGWSTDNMELVREGDWLVGEFRFERVPTGKFVLRCPVGSFARELLVPPEGLVGVELEIGPPSILRLSFVDRASGEPVAVDRIFLDSAIKGSVNHQEADVLELRVPPGDLRFTASFARHVNLVIAMDVPPGRTERIFPVDRCPMVIVTLPPGAMIPNGSGGGLLLPQTPRLEPAGENSGYVARSEMGGNSARFMVNRPGRYRLIMPLYADFMPTEPLEFDLGPGEELRPNFEWIPR